MRAKSRADGAVVKIVFLGSVALWLVFAVVAAVDDRATARIVALVHHE